MKPSTIFACLLAFAFTACDPVPPVVKGPTKTTPQGPTKADPTKADPTKADPTKADPTKTDPKKADPTIPLTLAQLTDLLRGKKADDPAVVLPIPTKVSDQATKAQHQALDSGVAKGAGQTESPSKTLLNTKGMPSGAVVLDPKTGYKFILP